MRGGVCESNRLRRGKLFPFFERGEQGVRSLVNVTAAAGKITRRPRRVMWVFSRRAQRSGSGAAAPKKESEESSDDINALKNQVAALQRKLDKLEGED